MSDAPPSSRRRRAAPRRPSWLARALTVLVAMYAAGLVAVLAILLAAVDRHWVGTLIGFGPRWVFALPLPVLALAALALRRALLIPLAACALLVAFPILDLSVGLGGDDRGQPLRIVTQNLGATMKLEDPRFVRFLDETRADVVVLQECWRDEAPTASPHPDYHFAMDHTLCVLSRFPIAKISGRPRDDVWDRGGAGEIAVAELTTPHGPVWLLALQLETAREGFEAFLVDKLGGVPKMNENVELRRWESQLATAWAAEHARSPMIVAGDLNMPVESAIYKEHWSRYQNAWTRCGSGFGYTKRTRRIGARIDHVLFDDRWGCADAALAPDLGSDHRGVVVDLRLLPGGG